MPPERYKWDTSHHFARALKIGRIMSVLRFPTLPGDGHDIQIEGKLDMAELRKALPVDVRADMYAFWCPYRHTYEDMDGRSGTTGLAASYSRRWQDYVFKGHDQTGQSRSILGIHDLEMANSDFLNFLPVTNASFHRGMPNEACLFPHDITLGKIPRHVVMDYYRIWDYYFRHPNQGRLLEGADSLGSDFSPKTLGDEVLAHMGIQPSIQLGGGAEYANGVNLEDNREFGLKVNNMKNLTTAMRKPGEQIDEDDWLVPEVTSGATTGLDLRKLHEYQMRHSSETEREYYMADYDDVMRSYGGNSNLEEPKPMLIAPPVRTWLSGGSVTGTGDGNLGVRSGFMNGVLSMHIPRKFIPEHGTIYALVVLRIPAIYESEIHRLDREDEFKRWHTLVNEPGFSDRMPREQWTQDMLFADGASGVVGEYGAQEHYRTHVNNVHRRFLLNEYGFPYLKTVISGNLFAQILHRDYGLGTGQPIFRSEPFGHATFTGIVKMTSMRHVAPPAKSLMLV